MILWSIVNILMETNIFQNTLFYYFHSRHKTSFSCRVYPNPSLDYTTPLLQICYKDNRKIFSMKNKGRGIKKGFLSATTILLALIVVVLISSCSSDTPQLCNVSVQLEGSGSRELSAVIDPINRYTIYYKSIYKGSGASYGNMAESDPYKKLDENGILVSQGLWEIQAIFKETDQGNTYSPSTSDLIAASGNIYINLNTESISVSYPSQKGYVYLTQYLLRSIPSSVTNVSINVNVYKYDTETSSFSSAATNIPVGATGTGSSFSSTDSIQLDSGLYYAVLSVKGTVSGSLRTVFTDCIGFIVRSGLTTKISGYCETYNTTVSTNNVKNPSSSGGSSSSSTIDIKDFTGSQFNEDVYTIVDNDYTFVASSTSGTYEKTLTGTQNVTIDMNGHAIFNSTNETDKTYFLLTENSSLTVYNSVDNNKTVGPVTIASKKVCQEANYIVSGGTLSIGSTSTDLQKGQIALQGVPAGQAPPATEKNSAIEYTSYGGVINLLAPSKDSSINIENTIRGISRRVRETNQNEGNLNLTINMANSAINAAGETQTAEAGIYIDGTDYTTTSNGQYEYYYGSINISISGTGKDGKSICTSNVDSKTGVDSACIVIKNYAGNINLKFDANSYLLSKHGCAIALINCTGSVYIENKGTLLGSIESNGTTKKEKNGVAIYLDNCSNVTIFNSGTLSSDSSSYEVTNIKSSVTVTKTDSNGNTNGKDVSIYSSSTSQYKR